MVDVFTAARDGLTDVLRKSLPPLGKQSIEGVDEEGLGLLHHAVDAEQEGATALLLELRADPNVCDASSSTPLHYASLLGSASLAKMLLDAGASRDLVDEDGKTAVEIARSEGHDDSLIALLAAADTSSASTSIPLIDIGAFARGTASERASIAADFDTALRSIGICHLTNYEHLLPANDIESLRTAAVGFFQGDAEAKRLSHVDGVVGYLAVGDENVGASAGVPTAAPDPVESLNLPGYQEAGSEFRAVAAAEECPWRAAEWLPRSSGLKEAAVSYWGGATNLMLVLMTMSEIALSLPAGWFTESSYARPGTLLRLAWYPPTAAKTGGGGAAEGAASKAAAGGDSSEGTRYGAHTDYDGFTILQRAPSGGDVDGLEMQAADGRWLPVPSPPGTLTVNIGDLLARWTNDRWRATSHRVAQPKAGSAKASAGRLSIVYFTGPHPDTLVECLPSAKCKGEGETPKYAPITAYDHVLSKMNAATADARGESV